MNTLTITPLASGGCRGRHCAHDFRCHTPAPAPIPAPVPWSRGMTYCTCPPTWHAVIPPPPCPVHGKIHMLTVTCNTASASIPTEPSRYYFIGPAL